MKHLQHHNETLTNQWRSVGDLTTHAIFGLRLDDVIVLS